MTESGAFSEISRTSDSVIDAVQNHALYEQRLGIGAPLGDPGVRRIAMPSAEKNSRFTARF